jgi:DNA-binding GntR family transcriptional regulator
MTLKRVTLGEQAYEELRARILSGTLQAGRRLRPYDLGTELQISQTPVREALALLTRDGLVVGDLRHACFVRRFQQSDLREIFEARIMLEVHAMRHACETGGITQAAIARLEDVFARQVEHASHHNPVVFAEAVKLDRDFHEALIALADNKLIAEWHRGALAQAFTILTYSMETFDARRAHDEHEAIIAAMRSGEPPRMEASLRAHLIAARDAILTRTPALAEGGRDAA